MSMIVPFGRVTSLCGKNHHFFFILAGFLFFGSSESHTRQSSVTSSMYECVCKASEYNLVETFFLFDANIISIRGQQGNLGFES